MTKIAYLYTKSKRWCGFDSCRQVSGYIKLSLIWGKYCKNKVFEGSDPTIDPQKPVKKIWAPVL